MDMANAVGGLVVGTGDLSEAALGWCTYNGDHMSMYHVNAGVPKTLVKTVIQWFARHPNGCVHRIGATYRHMRYANFTRAFAAKRGR